MFNNLRKWLAGEFRQTPLNIVLSGEPFENLVRPWPIRAWRKLLTFWMRHWQFLIGSLIAIAGVIVTIMHGGNQ
jgi:hypothetical protein